MGKTTAEVQAKNCWLLFLVAGTRRKQTTAQEDPALTGLWLASSKTIVETNCGTVSQFLPRGFLAYWQDQPEALADLSRLRSEFKTLRESLDLDFWLALHFGQVFSNNFSPSAQESLFGKAVEILFEMGKIAPVLGEQWLVSETAHRQRGEPAEARALGSHAFPGIGGQHRLYAF